MAAPHGPGLSGRKPLWGKQQLFVSRAAARGLGGCPACQTLPMVFRCDQTHQHCVHGPQKCGASPEVPPPLLPRGNRITQAACRAASWPTLPAPALTQQGRAGRHPSPWLLEAGLATRVPDLGLRPPAGRVPGTVGAVTSQRGRRSTAHEACQEGWVSPQSKCGLEKNVRTESVSERRRLESREQSQRSSARTVGWPPDGQGEPTVG